MSTKIYKIAVREAFYKHTKKTDSYKESVRYDFLVGKTYKTYQDAQDGLHDYVANKMDFAYDLTGYHWEHIIDNTYKLTYKDTKNFRMCSFQICEFDELLVMDQEEMNKIKK